MFHSSHETRRQHIPFLQENGKLIFQFLFTLLFIGLGWWFIRNEKAELGHVRDVLFRAEPRWIIAGIGVVLFYILVQGLMYKAAFSSVHTRIGLGDALLLFLRRNFISVFLPAGGVSSLAFYTKEIEKKGISKTQIYYASSIYGFVGILSVVIVAVPAFLYALTKGHVGGNEWLALLATFVLLAFIYWLYKALISKGKIYNWLISKFPKLEVYLDEFQSLQTHRIQIVYTILLSVLIELIGITHAYIAMLAFGFSPSILSAVMAYLVVVVFLIVSPFLRGLGAIEVSMTYILTQFGYSNVEAIAIMILFRFFEFWLPLFTGMLSFLLKIDKLLMRIIPSILLLFLGVVNIVSVLTPAISERLKVLHEFFFSGVIFSSNLVVLVTGLLLLVTAVFMLKGLRSAWWLALFLSIVSVVGHLTKGIDYEEASVALLIIAILLFTRKEYYIRNNPKLRMIGIRTALFSTLAVFVYGIVGFYFLDKKQFSIEFSFIQSVKYTFQNFFLVGNSDLVPRSAFARDFLWTIKGSGFISIVFLLYTFIRPYVLKEETSEDEYAEARDLTEHYGKSQLDYFKTYFDKLIFRGSDGMSFIAYKVSGNFAVALEDPVAPDAGSMKQCIEEFRKYCFENGLKDIYYRVPSESLPVYKSLKKKAMFLGQEGVVDTFSFSLEGRSMKSVRNAISKVKELGYVAKIIQPPVLDGTIQKLKAVSNEWLQTTGREEIIFSQGMFSEIEIKYQTVIVVENKEEKIIAFLNIIPDFAPDEGTFDLLRKTKDAPNGVMDFILIELINYLKNKHIHFLNLGFAPLSGLTAPDSFPEKSIKFAYEKIRSFSHYKGMREYKEKFNPVWNDKYLVYSHDYDLIQAPVVLSNVIKP